MNTKLIYLWTVIAAMLLMGFSACDKEDDKNIDPEEKEWMVRAAEDENLLISGTLKGKLELKSETYILAGSFLVGEGAELHIPAGTTIKSNDGFANYILVLQGGKIFVNGTADKPVKMTSSSSKPKQGAWGGLIINGRAPLSGGEIGTTEINSDYTYGGNNPDDSSGSITYLILEYTGARASADTEHNGLTLNGVGRGTKIENLYIPYGADDAIEFFGGCVNVKNLLAVDPDDDMFDFTQGYTGTLENCYGIWQKGYVSTEDDPRGVEADGNLDGEKPDQKGQSDFTIKNMTIDLRLAASEEEGYYMHDVLKIRRGARATIINALVKGEGKAKDLIDMTDKKGDGLKNSSIDVTNALTNPVFGKELNGEAEVKMSNSNTGCPTDIFSWTGYKF